MCPGSASDCPLSVATRRRLVRIGPTLAQVVDFDATLSACLKSVEALSWTQYERVTAERLHLDRTLQLLHVLQRRSVTSLARTRDALHMANNNTFLTKYLYKGFYNHG